MYSEAIEDIYPLSSMQQGMLFHSLYSQGSGVYVEVFLCTLHGHIPYALFERAWQQVVNRHQVLRTAFLWEDIDEPLQVVHAHVPVHLTLDDVRALGPEEQRTYIQSLVQDEHHQGFDLTEAPLLRLRLVQLTDTRHTLVWCFHHIILDGWSVPLLLKEVFTFFEAYCLGRDASLPLPKPYSEYIAWLSQRENQEEQSFWQRTLEGFTEPTPLTMAHTVPPSSRPAENAEQRLSLSREATRALRDLARQERLTLNTLLLGAWALLLGYYSGQDEVLFGTTLAGRPADLAGVEEMLGLFITTVPVRVLLPGQQRLLEWLHAVQGHLLEVQQHGGYPLPRIQAYSQVPPGLPLFESLLVLEDYPGDNSRLLWGEQVHIDHSALKEQTNYPLTLVIIPAPSLRVTITYDGARFKKHLIRSLLEHFALLLESIVAHPEQVLGDIPCLGEDERQQVLVEWNATQAPKGGSSCLHHLFEAQAERTPKAVAVISGEQQITYQELNDRANHLGLYLRHLGVGPEVLVGICVERSPDMLVGLLGILKAGGAYVPVDPSYPQDRRDFMLQDARVSFVLAQRSTLHILETAHIPVVCMDELEQGSYSEGDPIESGEMSPQHLAYVIYTSGSTGKPKGVAITHASAVTLMQWARDVFPREALTGVLAGTSLCFDLSVFEIFVPLSWGGTIVLAENVLHLVDLPDPGVVKMINTVPSVLTELVYARPLPESIRIVNLAGESLSPRLVQQLYQQQTVEKVFNLYGPSEDTTYSTYSLVTADETGSPPIGKPIHNTQAYVLNARLEPVPIGVIGELYLGGEGLARGYLHRPEITAERFVPHPWSGQPGTRLYRTGDLVRYRPDGNLEFLGRLDRQVKVRGYRIELGEIEAVLTRHPAVNEAVVIVREDKPAEKQLVAYLIAKTNDIPGREVLQRFLQAQIPNYMLPAAFVWLKSWPLSPHGKLDRNALPPPDGARHGLEAAYVAPRNEIEHTLAAIWQDVLHLEKVGLYDNFFDLGGSSLLLLRVQSRLQEALGREIALLEFFNYPTIYALSEYISLKEPARATEEVFRRVEKRRNTSQRQRQRVEAKKKEL